MTANQKSGRYNREVMSKKLAKLLKRGKTRLVLVLNLNGPESGASALDQSHNEVEQT